MTSEQKHSPKTIGIKAKVENKDQYQQYLDELKPLQEELGITLKEDLYPEEKH
jgi:cytochrome c oxidase subunit 5a